MYLFYYCILSLKREKVCLLRINITTLMQCIKHLFITKKPALAECVLVEKQSY